MRVLGIEGTAWAASAALFETTDPTRASDSDHVHVETEAYQPASGGIHPREAAEHMGEAVPQVVERVLAHARERQGIDAASGETERGADAASAAAPPDPAVDAVAFSRGPGLGPCLRIVATAARALAQRLDVPLVGVNHMVAHLEVGRHFADFDAPVCLNASGANAHLLGFRAGRYRVLGETMDTGVGNALDKFTRHVGWSHPGGPKVEEHAKAGEYVDLPYVVKGMDFSFSGIMSAAKQRVDEGTPVADVCRGLEETMFGMLAEVSERALALTGADELVLGGGVGQNARLRSMLAEMCEQRGAEFFAPPARFLRDNAGMIAILGAKMHAAGDHLAIADSGVDPDFRPDRVPVTWRAGERVGRERAGTVQGAEARVSVAGESVRKERRPRTYRHPRLDKRLRVQRTRSEARLTSEARREGVPTPVVEDVDPREATLRLQRVGEADLRAGPTESRVRDVGRHLARLHDAGLVHGDPTTRNVRVGERTLLIDFGLGYHSGDAEDHAMDLHVFGQSLAGTAEDAEALREATAAAYRAESDHADAVFSRLADIEGRGRYQ